MLLLGKLTAYLIGIFAGIAILVPLLCITVFIMDNAAYLSEAIIDEITNLIHKIFKRNHKK